MLLAKSCAILIAVVLVNEVSGYLWHRWACHAGTFRCVFADFLRRRHFDHHTHKYPGAGGRGSGYLASCDIAFRVLGAILLIGIAVVCAVGWISLLSAGLVVLGTLTHAYFGAKLHGLYHVTDERARRSRFLRVGMIWHAFCWLREFHDAHHVVNANYALALPIVDMIGGTYVPPSRLRRLVAEDLFPGFDPNLSSSCGSSLFRTSSRENQGPPGT